MFLISSDLPTVKLKILDKDMYCTDNEVVSSEQNI